MQYQIIGEPFPALVCSLKDGETMISQSGAMAWMSPNMQMDTTSRGGLGAIFGRMLAGESLFLNRYKAQGDGIIAYATSFPGSILAFPIAAEKDLVVQKMGFLASEEGVTQSVFFQKKLGAGFFGGEGFVLQKLSGQGLAFIEIDGYLYDYELKDGQQVILNTGYLAAMEATCSIDIKGVSGVKNVLFGGQGFFNTIITGPGKVFIQTKPIHRLADALRPYFPTQTSSTSSSSS